MNDYFITTTSLECDWWNGAENSVQWFSEFYFNSVDFFFPLQRVQFEKPHPWPNRKGN